MSVRFVRTGAEGLPNSRGKHSHAIGSEFGKNRVSNATRGWVSWFSLKWKIAVDGGGGKAHESIVRNYGFVFSGSGD
jgi:hypothetical protein